MNTKTAKTTKNTETATTPKTTGIPMITADTTINSLAVFAFTTIILKGDRQTVDTFKQKLEDRKTAALATIQSNWDNGKIDKNGLPIGSAPNDIYNTISECELTAKLLMPENSDRVELAANTTRKLVATVCSEITAFKSKLAGKSAKTRTSADTDQSYL